MMKKFRMLYAGIFAVGVTFGLFLFMHMLVLSGGGKNEDMEAISGIHFGPVDIPEDILTRSRRKPPKPPPPKNPPPPPKMQVAKVNQVVQQMPRLDMPNIDNPMVGGDGIFIGNFAQVDKTAEGDMCQDSHQATKEKDRQPGTK